MKCPTCGDENQEGKRFCGGCGNPLPKARTEPGPIAQEKKPPFAGNRKMVIVVIAIVVILIVVVFVSAVTFLGQPSALPTKIQMWVYNQDQYDTIRVAIEIDHQLVLTNDVTGGYGGIVGAWTVSPGSHLVEINYYYPDYPVPNPLADPPEWAQSVEVTEHAVKDVAAYLAGT